jgi:hypothetical protein
MEDIMNFFELFENAQLRALDYEYVNHYTTLDTLEIILKNQSLMLNRIDRVNDAIEYKRIDDFQNRKGFISCFTGRQRESYFFWKVYSHKCRDQIGVRISFPADILRLNDFFFDPLCTIPLPIIKRTNIKINRNDRVSDWGLLNNYAVKVVYADNLKDYTYVDDFLKNTFGDCVNFRGQTFEKNALPCLVKSSEWDTEEEIRILALVRPKGMETILGKTCFVKNTYPQPFFENIFLKIPQSILKKCIFTVSPRPS